MFANNVGETAGYDMKKEAANNYYELLAIRPGATESEIQEAYFQTKALYGQDSVAAYSLYSGEEKENFLREINEAYLILLDPVKRREYDMSLTSLADAGNDMHLVKKDESPQKTTEKYFTLKCPLAVMNDDDSTVAEQFRILYTKLEQISHTYSYKNFAFTSALKGEGKSSTSFNLAYIMAHEFQKKVLILDCDLRKPSIKSYLSEEPSCGLTDVVKGDVSLDEAIIKLKESSLHILPSGSSVRNSSEILNSGIMKKVLSALKEQFDYIILDSPPVLSLADMNIISKMVDGIALVVRAGETPMDVVQKAVNSLPDGKIIGIVLNGAEVFSRKYRYYY